VFCTVMVIDNAVIAAVLLSLSPWSSKKGLLELTTGVAVTPPVPVAPVTVKLTALLVFPATATVTFTTPAAILGTVTCSEVAVAAVTVAIVVPKETVLAFAVVLKFVPVIVIEVPGAPDVGASDVMVGVGVATPVTVKLTALLVFPATATVTFTAPAAMLGTVTLSAVPVAEVTVAAVEPNVTVLALAVVLKFVPAIVTDAPAAADAGVMELMVGAGVTVPPPRGNWIVANNCCFAARAGVAS